MHNSARIIRAMAAMTQMDAEQNAQNVTRTHEAGVEMDRA
jgi:hypothetical protein